jgi:DNA polymerase-1
MSRLIYDIETDGLRGKELSKVHCIVTMDADTKVIKAYYNPEPGFDCPEYPPAGTVGDGVRALADADVRIGHWVVGFDELVLRDLYGMPEPKELVDTCVAMSVIYPFQHLKIMDKIAHGKGRCLELIKKDWGSHSLKAWGFRLNVHKDEYGSQTTDWKAFTPGMLSYCVQDVKVAAEIYKVVEANLLKGNLSMRSLRLETAFAQEINDQMETGFGFDVDKAEKLASLLQARCAEVKKIAAEKYPPIVKVTISPKLKKRREKSTPFNVGSRMQVADYLKKHHGWVPTEFTPTGRPMMEDEILEQLPYEGIDEIREYWKTNRVLSMLLNEKGGGWLQKVKLGRVHGYVRHNGAVTSRCTHDSPNIPGTPAVHKDKAGNVLMGWKGGFGWECRDLFKPRDGWAQVGVDVSGLEARRLAHYMAEFDGGAFAKVVLEGDIHSANMAATGITDRALVKTFYYAFLYGAGDKKLAKTLGKSVEEAKRLRGVFLAGLPALARVLWGVKEQAKQRGKLKLPDGRWVHCRSEHSALNTLLPGSGAICVKLATVIAHAKLQALGLRKGFDYNQMAHVHDEIQFECKPELAQLVGETTVQAIEEAGEKLGSRCPLTGEFKVGRTWAETH